VDNDNKEQDKSVETPENVEGAPAPDAENVSGQGDQTTEVEEKADAVESASTPVAPEPVERPKSRKRLILIIVLAVVLLLAGAAFAFKDVISQKLGPENLDPQYNSKTSDAGTTKTEIKTDDTVKSAELVTYTSESYGITMKIPKDWEQKQSDTAAELIAEDEKANITFHFRISLDTLETLTCPHVVKDTMDLTYSNPLPGQRKVTKLTYTAISPTNKDGKKTLCSMMITGAYAAVAGDKINPKDEVFQKSLPTNRIVIEVYKTDNKTDYPELDKALGSYRYEEVIKALESLQVK
jgi:hypothetical protein